MLSGRFWEIVFCVPLLFCRHVCLSNFKQAPSRELLLTACKTVFSHLKTEFTVFYLSPAIFYHSTPCFTTTPVHSLYFIICPQDPPFCACLSPVLQFAQFLALLNKKNTDTIIWPSKNNIGWRVDNKKEVIMKPCLSKRRVISKY